MRIRRLVMLRHGQTEYNAGSRMQGQLDTELSDLGRDQAVAAAEVLAKRQPLVIVSSDLRRALDTAVALGERAGMPVLVDTRLRETHLGDWQGHDACRGRCRGAGCPAGVARECPVGAARRGEPGRCRRPQHAAGGRADRRADRMGCRRSRAAGGAGRPRRPDRRVDRGAAGSARRQLADPGRDGQRQLGAAVRAFATRRRGAGHPRGDSTCGTPRHRWPTMSSDSAVRPTLLVFCDSLSYYGPTGGLAVR